MAISFLSINIFILAGYFRSNLCWWLNGGRDDCFVFLSDSSFLSITRLWHSPDDLFYVWFISFGNYIWVENKNVLSGIGRWISNPTHSYAGVDWLLNKAQTLVIWRE